MFTSFYTSYNFQVPVYEYPKSSIPEYASILVPNVDNTRTDYLIHALAKQSKVGTNRKSDN